MHKRTDNTVNIERWTVQDPGKRHADNKVVVTKVAVRNSLGQFHGATNFRGSVLRDS